jgi:hypothetical protein
VRSWHPRGGEKLSAAAAFSALYLRDLQLGPFSPHNKRNVLRLGSLGAPTCTPGGNAARKDDGVLEACHAATGFLPFDFSGTGVSCSIPPL